AAEDDDASLKAALDKLWRHLTSRQLYVTGGMGPAVENEGFTRSFDLPNETAYAETCAAVSLVFWGHRMAGIDLDGRFADHMELVLHNGALSGVSLAGDAYFYENPLESHGQHRRWSWHYCPCCPTNLARLVASLGGYVASHDDENVAIHLYAASTIDLEVAGRALRLIQQTAYPWDGDIRITVEADAPVPATLWLRIPGWCRDATASVNGVPVDVAALTRKGYLGIRRDWAAGDEIRLHLAMPVEALHAHPDVGMDADRVALKRGPVLYCVEEADNAAPPQHMRLAAGEAKAAFDAGKLGGVVTLAVPATIDRTADWQDTLYRPRPAETVAGTITAIPYFAWANREPGAMLVWLRDGR
ncbi:MAG: glycoside hydrolase family 127 protein, partial [Rhizobiales bacterium]|nr:glycoside hydrolase family 127 protein [Hyphomicrobiales bacterium]